MPGEFNRIHKQIKAEAQKEKNNMAYIVDPINNTLIDDEKPFKDSK